MTTVKSSEKVHLWRPGTLKRGSNGQGRTWSLILSVCYVQGWNASNAWRPWRLVQCWVDGSVQRHRRFRRKQGGGMLCAGIINDELMGLSWRCQNHFNSLLCTFVRRLSALAWRATSVALQEVAWCSCKIITHILQTPSSNFSARLGSKTTTWWSGHLVRPI